MLGNYLLVGAMNDQEKAQHIGEILLADYKNKIILLDNDEQVTFSGLTLNQTYLFSMPERYSIKPEPECINFTIYRSLTNDRYEIGASDSEGNPVDKLSSGEVCVLVSGKIEIPNQKEPK